MKTETKISSIEEMRSIIRWAGYQNEDFNDQVKSMKDWVKIWEYIKKEDIEFIDNLPNNDYYTAENNLRYATELNKILGYKLFDLTN